MEDGGQSTCAEEAPSIHALLLLSSSIMLLPNAASIEVVATKITNRISNPLKWLVEAEEKKQRSQFQERKEGRSTLFPKPQTQPKPLFRARIEASNQMRAPTQITGFLVKGVEPTDETPYWSASPFTIILYRIL